MLQKSLNITGHLRRLKLRNAVPRDTVQCCACSIAELCYIMMSDFRNNLQYTDTLVKLNLMPCIL